jgi:NADP-dependent alcohol dehydrogenase
LVFCKLFEIIFAVVEIEYFMNNFTYNNPVRIHFGKGQIGLKLPVELSGFHKIMFCYGGGSIKRNGVYNQVLHALEGKDYIEFGGIEVNPTYETLMNAVDIAGKESVDFILAVGGGSVIDGAKFIAAARYFDDGDPWDMLSIYKKFNKALPLGTVLTLPATGSEMNGNAVITRKSTTEKLAFGSPLLYPVFSVLDPETMYSLPDTQISNGIIDAYIHVMEQYLTYSVDAPLQDRFAESILRTLIEEGPRVLKNRTNYEANANLMWAACMALNGIIKVGVPEDWSTHMIGHELTALYGIDHAKTLAIVLPGVMSVLQDQKKEKLMLYGRRVWNVSDNIEEVIDITEGFFHRVGIRTRLKDYKLGPDIIEKVCDRLLLRGYTELGEHKNVNPEIVRKILQSRL